MFDALAQLVMGIVTVVANLVVVLVTLAVVGLVWYACVAVLLSGG